MTPDHEKCYPVLLRYAQLFAAEYHEKWIPTPEHITQTVDLFKSPMPGFEGYTPDELIARLVEFFKIKEPWLVGCKHNYGVFTKHIHRWIPRRIAPIAKPASVTAPTVSICPDCNEPIKPGEVCPVCYPRCEKCDQYHAPEDDCEEFAARMTRLNAMLSSSEKRFSKSKGIGDILHG